MDQFAKVLGWIAVFALLAMMIQVVSSALLRKVVQTPIPGNTEIVSVWYMPLVTLIGIYLCQHVRSHVSVALLVEQLPRKVQSAFDHCGDLAMIALFGAITYFSWLNAVRGAELGVTEGVSAVPLWPMLFVLPGVSALVCVTATIQILTRIRNRPLAQDSSVEGVGHVRHA